MRSTGEVASADMLTSVGSHRRRASGTRQDSRRRIPATRRGTMKPQAIIDDLCATLDGVVPKSSWGETALFYNPGRALPNGVYFCTFKERDGENDRASVLTRDGVFRVSIGVSPATDVERFGPRPARPAKGGVVNTGHDFAALDVLTPHPVYAWKGWVQILSPTASR